MPKFRTYIEGASGGEHLIEAEFTFSIGNDGIGSYEYWGVKGFDKGFNYIEDILISSVYLIRANVERPYISKSLSNISNIRKKHIGWEGVYKFEHSRKISLNDDFVMELEKKIKEEFDFEGEVELPEQLE